MDFQNASSLANVIASVFFFVSNMAAKEDSPNCKPAVVTAADFKKVLLFM